MVFMGKQGGLNMCCAWPDSCCLSEAAGCAGGVKSSHQGCRKSENETKTKDVASDRKRLKFPHLSFLPPSLDQEGSVFTSSFIFPSLPRVNPRTSSTKRMGML